MAVTCMLRLSQLCRPPSTLTPERSSDAVVGAARSNVMVSAAAQHGEGEALRHRRRACAALRGSAAGVLARDERLSRSALRFISNYEALDGKFSTSAEDDYLPTYAARARGRAANYLPTQRG